MTGTLTELSGTTVFVAETEGPIVGTETGAIDLIGATYGTGVDLVAVPVDRLGPEFFRLRTGLAGGFIQKFRNYQLRLAIVGDISAHIAQSAALRDFVIESNRGRDVLFVASLDDLATSLGNRKG